MQQPPSIIGLGLATPDRTLTQAEALRFARPRANLTPTRLRSLDALYRMTTVRRRACALLQAGPEPGNGRPPATHVDARDADLDDAYPTDDAPTTARRMYLYRRVAPSLAEAAARNALHEARIEPADVTHLVIATCTGFHAPGIDHHLIQRLALPPGVARLQVGFMGCHAALNALRAAHAFTAADPRAVVLTVCVELCSAHFQYGDNRDHLLANALFADGAAAFVLAAPGAPAPPATKHRWRVRQFASHIIPDSAAAMAWTISDHGFQMTLHAAVPRLVAEHTPAFIDRLLAPSGLDPADIRAWAIHPGGPRVVSAVGSALRLPPEALEPSLHVLRQHGNMSSPTVLYILDHLAADAPPGPVVMLSFGPGLAAEAALLDFERLAPR